MACVSLPVNSCGGIHIYAYVLWLFFKSIIKSFSSFNFPHHFLNISIFVVSVVMQAKHENYSLPQ